MSPGSVVRIEQLYRFREPRDAFDPSNPTLAEVLQVDAEASARCLAFVDSGLATASPLLENRMREWARSQPSIDLIDVHTLSGGEACKNDASVTARIIDAMLDAKLCRHSYVLAVGGGAMLDAVGYAAATFHRGVRLVRLPSTTLAQADAGIGVKNAINHCGIKNLLGTFAVPWAVINDSALLATLDNTTWRHGFSEAVKVALVKDAAFFDQLQANAPAIADRDSAASQAAISRSAKLHLDHILTSGDPFEQSTARPLDFGHWSAHRLEAMSGFTLAHGDAVAIGVAIDAAYSHLRHKLPAADLDRIITTLRRLGFSLTHPLLTQSDALLQGLDQFREHLGGRLTLSMLHAPGESVDIHDVDRGAMLEAVARVRESASVGATQ